MPELSAEQIRCFRLHSHHLDAEYQMSDKNRLAGACGLQNTPPGAWETALFNRAPGCSLNRMEELLYREKSLLQAWSLRGAPMVFPAAESGIFLSALLPEEGEPWIYTQGIGLALDFLKLPFDELLEMLKQVIPRLNETVIESKGALDQTLAGWMLPLLPAVKRDLWNQPSMYGSPDKQTVGGAVVSFLLRPCAFSGLVVFGERRGISPSFTSYKSWTGHMPEADGDAVKKLVRKYLHCYGPATVDTFTGWLGCSGKQGRRMWRSVAEELETVTVCGKKAFLLSEDRERLLTGFPVFPREVLLLGAHDPYLDQRDRLILQPVKSLHREIWKTVSNPGVILYRGEAAGVWSAKIKNKGLEVKLNVFPGFANILKKQELQDLAEAYAAFRRQKLNSVE